VNNMRKLTIENMYEIAAERNGKCLSTEYINNSTNLEWECERGHKWKATPANIRKGTWCKVCSGKQKASIEDMHKIASERDGKCLSTEYINDRTHLKWECEEGHQWEATPSNIKRGKWCKACTGLNKGSIEEMHQIAASKNGKCLSNVYTNSQTKLTWECEKGHTWKAVPSSIKSGKWCKKCVNYQKGTIDDMKELAQKRNGSCLSTTYTNSTTPLMWQCADGHTWDASPSSIKNGSWCPHCHFHFTEEKVRHIFEQLFNAPFKKTRKVVEGNLELDGYNKELNIAFEYNGIQHYEYTPYFHRSAEEVQNQKDRDYQKMLFCSDNLIALIVVPYWESNSDKELIAYIKQELTKQGIKYPKTQVKLDDFYTKTSVLDELREFAKERGGKLLSTSYIRATHKLEWECADGHTWKATAYSVKQGSWCKRCAGFKSWTIEEMHEIANEKNGKCLSETYVSYTSHLKWVCIQGHQWKATPANIIKGKWCKVCAGVQKLTIEQMHELAVSRNGKCLSEEYVGANTPLIWECELGHSWKASPSSIKQGTWCKVCAGTVKGTIEEMQKVAKERGGKCLSTTYINARTNLKWQCKKGHTWEATPGSVKGGTWCPNCSGRKRLTIEDMVQLAEKRNGKCLSTAYINNSTKLLWECENGHTWRMTPQTVKNKKRWCQTCKNEQKLIQ